MAKKILIADDEQDILEIVTDLLTAANYVVIQANNGQEAIEKIVREKPDLILLDIRMPGLNGIEVCKRVKEDPMLKKIPLFFISASSAKMTPEMLQSTKAEGYLCKPFDAISLLQKVKEFV